MENYDIFIYKMIDENKTYSKPKTGDLKINKNY